MVSDAAARVPSVETGGVRESEMKVDYSRQKWGGGRGQ